MSIFRTQISSLGKWGRGPENIGMLTICQSALLDEFPGPAFITDKKAGIQYFNIEAEALMGALEAEQSSTFREALEQGCKIAGPSFQTVTIDERDADATIYDLTFLPLNDANFGFLVTAKNVSLQRNLTNALIASRQLFKDLVTCTAEFVWETDELGQFRYVSPRGGMGYSAAELDGLDAASLLMGSGDFEQKDLPNPFYVSTPISSQLTWLRSKSNSLVYMRVTSIPVFDKSGKWIGCRGAGQDVTEEMARANRMAQLASQEAVFSSIVNAVRREVDAEKLFALAGEETCEALGASRLWIARQNASGHLEEVFNRQIESDLQQNLFDWYEAHRDTPLPEYKMICETFKDWKVYICPLLSKNELDGFIALVRKKEAMDPDEPEMHLLRHLSEHLEVALIQIKAREQLITLTRTDELSGLLNRRAFHHDVTKRIAHGKRTKASNALFYVDLDNFKPVNDRFGHEKGDQVLKAVSDLLHQNSRVGDMVARLGGDEFAIWFENMTLEEAREKADSLQKKCKEISKVLEIVEPALGFSIGIAMASGEEQEHLEGLLSHADSAMYEVKRQGKGTYFIAGDKLNNATGAGEQ